MSENETCTARPSFSWAEHFFVFAIWLASSRYQSWPSLLVLAVYLLTWLYGCNRTRLATIQVLFAIYLPVALGLLCKISQHADRPPWQQYLTLALLHHADATMSLASQLLLSGLQASIFLSAVSTIRFYPKARSAVLSLLFVVVLIWQLLS